MGVGVVVLLRQPKLPAQVALVEAVLAVITLLRLVALPIQEVVAVVVQHQSLQLVVKVVQA